MKIIKLFTLSFFISVLLPISVFAASASFSVTGGGNVTIGQNVSVTISVNGSEAYNAVNVNVAYNNLTYVSSSASSGWTTVSGPTNNGSSVNFSGAVLGNSYTGSKSVLTLNLKANANGKATISPSGTIALSDGNGTQVSGGGNTASYTVSPAPTATPAPKPLPNGVNVSSSSNADQNTWYKNKTVNLTWNKESEVSDFSYILDQSPTTNPDDTSEGGDITKKYDNLSEGVSYFHIKAKNTVGWGTTSHFKINVDTSLPDPFTITVKDTGDKYAIYFSTNDSVSGIAKYTLSEDKVDAGEQKSGILIAKNYKSIEVTAFDLAGNTAVSTFNVDSNTITSTTTPVNVTEVKENGSLPLEIIFGILALILLAYGTAISYLYWRKTKLK